MPSQWMVWVALWASVVSLSVTGWINQGLSTATFIFSIGSFMMGIAMAISRLD